MRLTKLSQIEELVKSARSGKKVCIYFVVPLHWHRVQDNRIEKYTLARNAQISGDYLSGLCDSSGQHCGGSIFGQVKWFDNYWFAYADLLKDRQKEAENV